MFSPLSCRKSSQKEGLSSLKASHSPASQRRNLPSLSAQGEIEEHIVSPLWEQSQENAPHFRGLVLLLSAPVTPFKAQESYFTQGAFRAAKYCQ